MRQALVIQPTLRQSLVLTPKLQQAIKVMQMTSLELQYHITQELEQNPLLEDGLDVDADQEILDELRELDSRDLETVPNESEVEPEINIEDFLDDSLPSYGDEAASGGEDEEERRDDLAQPISFHEHLLTQLHLHRLPPADRFVAELLIGNFNDEGFFLGSLDEIAEQVSMDPSDVEEILTYVQTHLEPLGVGSRSRQEYFLLQLRAQEEPDPLAIAIVERHYDDLLKNQVPRIAKQLADEGFSQACVERVQQAKECLGKLQLNPAQGFLNDYEGVAKTRSDARAIVPDVVVERVDGEWRVRAVDESIPRVHLNRRYLQMLQNGSRLTTPERKWLEDYRQRAKELIESIYERSKTIEYVAREIFDVQRDFLEQGVKHLKPLVLRDIAERLGKHESTISRATNGKYVQTPRGVYELKYFFSSGLEQDSGDMASSTSVRALIEEMVQQEDVGSPLSDQRISELLEDKGIKVARRTVAKYREELGIAPSSQRKNRW